MKWIVWTLGGLLAALWTGALAAVLALVGWAGAALQPGGPVVLPSQPLPAWLGAWVDPAAWDAVVRAMQQGWQALQSVLPAMATAAGWLEPVAWTLWGLGMVLLLLAAAGSHWLLARRTAGPRPAA